MSDMEGATMDGVTAFAYAAAGVSKGALDDTGVGDGDGDGEREEEQPTRVLDIREPHELLHSHF